MAANTEILESTTARLTRAQFAVALLLIVLAALAVRFVFPTADPPSRPGIGIVWHDEGAWVHNARNRALFGAWKLDEWNPMYVTPVLTGLEYVSFRLFGVGLRQARLVPELLGVLSVWLIGLGVARTAGRLAGLFAAALLATNFAYVMYNRAATIEGTMVALLVVAWYAYARAGDSPRWGLAAGAGAVVAYFTKASAVFFVAAMGLDAVFTLVVMSCRVRPETAARSTSLTATPGVGRGVEGRTAQRAAFYTLAGVAIAGLVALAVFVLPNWSEYRFYNWQISVSRKPSYALRAFVDRASQLPLAADFFSRMWLVLVVGVAAAVGSLAIWRKRAPAERLLLLWLGLGAAELIIHDIQERRLLILAPALIALAAAALARRRLVPEEIARTTRRRALVVAPIVAYGLYAIAGAVTRLPSLLSSPAGEHPAPAIRVAAAAALVLAVLVYLRWDKTAGWLRRQQWSAALSLVLVLLAVSGDVAQFGYWAAMRTSKNYEAMKLIGASLPPGTLVHGKLANGLALENGIRPVFVGRGFGNYADRARRDDIRYLVTYITPFVGYEGGRDASGRPIILDVLDAYPGWRVVRTFDVAESDGGHDVAALIDKMPERR